MTAMLAWCGVLAACGPRLLDSAPASPSQPWSMSSSPSAAGNYAVPPQPEAAILKPTPGLADDKPYRLAELIDLAQTENPTTRVAWQQARQAAIAGGAVEALYLPQIAVNVIGGTQKVTTTLPLVTGGTLTESTWIRGASPQLVLQWLLFDFGQRDALHESAARNAMAANVLFNAAHQAVIRAVTTAYLTYCAARERVHVGERTLVNSQRIEAAAQARMRKGLGTTVEAAQARQEVAQARFNMVQAQGGEQDAYQALLHAVGISPTAKIRVQETRERPLPESVDAPTEAVIEAALARRPDVLASFWAAKASKAGVGAAEAAFYPRIYLGAIAAAGTTNLSATGLPTIGQQSSTTGVLVGATMPIFDGGLRRSQLENAKSLAAASEASFERTKADAAREIVVAFNALRSSLTAYRAAAALTDAAAVTYDATLAAYEAGVGPITADSGLLAAQQAKEDGYAAARIASANLAFVLGEMTSAQAKEASAR